MPMQKAGDPLNEMQQQTLWSSLPEHETRAPLADRMRPRTLDEFLGQKHLLGQGRLLRRAIQADKLQSSIFWGPPGCGKTTLASIIAGMTGSAFEKLNAVTSGVADVRKVLKEAEERRMRQGKATYLLLDECHRWSKSQSDSILPAIESGLIRFIGSTTENPMASMTPAIVSRCRVFQFEPLTVDDVEEALQKAIADKERGYGLSDVRCEDGALKYIAQIAGGDVRTALGALELFTQDRQTRHQRGQPAGLFRAYLFTHRFTVAAENRGGSCLAPLQSEAAFTASGAQAFIRHIGGFGPKAKTERAVHGTGIEVGYAQLSRKAAGQRAFAHTGRAVHSDDAKGSSIHLNS